MAPVLLELPVVGRLLAPFFQTPGTETKAVENLQKAADRQKDTRQKRKDDNNKYVIKVKDAMQCVEDHLGDGKLLWTLVKSLAHTVIGRTQIGPDVIMDEIFLCLEENALRQDTPRVRRTVRYSKRPS